MRTKLKHKNKQEENLNKNKIKMLKNYHNYTKKSEISQHSTKKRSPFSTKVSLSWNYQCNKQSRSIKLKLFLTKAKSSNYKKWIIQSSNKIRVKKLSKFSSKWDKSSRRYRPHIKQKKIKPWVKCRKSRKIKKDYNLI
jgi:hypothetical protein